MIGKKIFLRALELNDVQTLYALENDVDVWGVSDTMMPYSAFVLEQYVLEAINTDIYAAKQLRLVICDCNNGKPVGLIDLFDFSPRHQRANVGVLISKTFRGKGFAKEALQLLTDYAFSVLHLRQLVADLTEDNIDSQRLYQSVGFVHTATRKSWFLKENQWIDNHIYQLIKSE